MKAMEYQTICLMFWTLMILFVLVASFTWAYSEVEWSMINGRFVNPWFHHPYRNTTEFFTLLALIFLVATLDSFRAMHNALKKEKKEVVK